MKRDRRKFIN